MSSNGEGGSRVEQPAAAAPQRAAGGRKAATVDARAAPPVPGRARPRCPRAHEAVRMLPQPTETGTNEAVRKPEQYQYARGTGQQCLDDEERSNPAERSPAVDRHLHRLPSSHGG